MRLRAGILLLLWVVSGSTAAQGQEFEPGEILVRFAANAKAHEKADRLAQVGATTTEILSLIQTERCRLSNTSVEEAVRQLSADPLVVYAEPNYIWRADLRPNDQLFSFLWGLENVGQTQGTVGTDINMIPAWDTITDASSVVVGVIDTGIDIAHPDLIDNIYVNPAEIPNNGIDDDGNGFIDDVSGWDFRNDDNNPFDDRSHGTHVAGTIGARGHNGLGVVGVCWRVQLLPLKFLGANGAGNNADAIKCIQYALLMGAQVSNNSWGGGPFSNALYAAIEAASVADHIFVAAAGNSTLNNDAIPHYPGSYDLPNIVSVASTNDRDLLSSFSNWGAVTVDLAAPGSNIYSTLPFGRYGLNSGTSMAAPHVTGVVALMRAQAPGVNYPTIVERLLATTEPVAALAGRTVTGGRLNALLAVADPDSIAPAPIDDLRVVTTGSNHLDLTWTATGDDGREGRASIYDLRVSTSTITADNFPSATAIQLEPPVESGGTETVRVGDLAANTDYFFAMVVFDDFSNVTNLSNTASAQTERPPTAAISPDLLKEELLTGASADASITISNQGPGTLDFAISGVVYEPKAAAQRRATVPSRPLDSYYGPPDPSRPAHRVEVDMMPPMVRSKDAPIFFDDMEQGDNDWTHTSTHLNGNDLWHLTDDRAHSGSTSWRVPQHSGTGSDALRSPTIDLRGFRAATLSFQHWYRFDDCDDPTLDADGGVVEITVDDGNTWLPLSPLDGYPYVLDDVCENPLAGRPAYAHQGGRGSFTSATFDLSPFAGELVAIRFHAGWDCGNCNEEDGWYVDDVAVTPGQPQWLILGDSSGSIRRDEPTNVDVQLDATGVRGGEHVASIEWSTNDPAQPSVSVLAKLRVTAAPDVFVSESLIDFGQTFVGIAAHRPIRVYNVGTAPLIVSQVDVEGPFDLDSAGAVLEPGAHFERIITFLGQSPDTFTGTITVTSDDPDHPTSTVTLTATAVLPPELVLEPQIIETQLFTNGSTTQPLVVRNVGFTPLEVDLRIENDTARKRVPRVHHRPMPSGISGGSKHSDDNALPKQTKRDAGRVLVVQNTLAWGLDISEFLQDEFGLDADLVSSTQLENVALNGYDLVITAGDEGDVYYQEISGFVDAFDGFVQSGGVMLYLAATHGADVTLPGGTIAEWGWHELRNLVEAPGHPLVSGLPDELEGDSANHMIFFELPNDATVITRTKQTGGPTAVEYARGDGIVIATGQPWEFLWRSEFAMGQMLPNGVGYALERARRRWVTLAVERVIVPAMDQVAVDIAMDAAFLGFGNFESTVHLVSNDPARPAATVATKLTVVSSSDVRVSTQVFDLGNVFLGGSNSKPLRIENRGTETLTVEAANVPPFVVASTSLIIEPGQFVDTSISFAPTKLGPSATQLELTTNDPDQSTVILDVQGTGLAAPAIVVTPTSIQESLASGTTAQHLLQISNEGGNDLHWQAEITTAATKDVRDLAGLNVLFDRAHGQQPWQDWSTTRGDLTARGANLWESSERWSTAQLASVDLLWLTDFAQHPSADELDALRAWLHSGGGLLIEGDDTPSVPRFNQVLSNVGSSLAFSGFDGAEGVSDLIAIHPTTRAVRRVHLVQNLARIASPSNPAVPLVFDRDGHAAVAVEELQNGRILVMSDELLDDVHAPLADNRRLANQLLHWLSGRTWMVTDPAAGTVPPGETATVTLTLQALTLPQGSHVGTLSLLNNDPIQPRLDVDVALVVSGSAQAVVEFSELDFPETPLGHSSPRSLRIWNTGTADLNVTASIADQNFAVDQPSLVVSPGAVETLQTTFAPTLVGPHTAQLMVTTNAAAQPTISVDLAGHGVVVQTNLSGPPPPHFGPIVIGESVSTTIEWTNDGNVPLELTSAATNAPFWVIATNQTLAVGETTYIEVGVQPSVAGTSEQSLGLVANGESVSMGTMSVEGIAAPILETSTDRIQEVMAAETHHSTFDIRNDGQGPLLVTVRPTLINAAPLLAPRAKRPHDDFGHTWTDSDTPGAPGYSWHDVRAHGTALALEPDGSTAPVPLPFPFPFYGDAHETIFVSRNGWISFAPNTTTLEPQRLPSTDVNGAIIAALWTTFEPGPGTVHVATTPHAVVVQYTDMQPTGGTSGPSTFQMTLLPDGRLEFGYRRATTPRVGWSVGMQNANGDDGMSVAHDTQGYLHDRLSVRVGEPVPWLSTSPQELSIAPGATMPLRVDFDATQLPLGVYLGALVLESNDPVRPIAIIGVDAAVTADETQRLLPNRASLHSVGPNPFRTRTRITYAVPRDGRVELNVYDVRGRRVRQLVAEPLAAGIHAAEWSGHDDQGRRVAGGMYFLRLEAGTETIVRRVSVTR